MKRVVGPALALALALPTATSPGATLQHDPNDPLRFFEGDTEMVSTTKIVMQQPFVTRTLGRGKIADDGALELVQHVTEIGRRQFDRFWRIREVAPGRFGGTMSEAIGPVRIDRKGERYLFRFSLKDGLSVEEWLIPQSGSQVDLQVTIRKYGIAVVHSKGWIRRLS